LLSTRDTADRLSTTPKILRQFLRQDDTFGGVGSGARYGIEEKDIPRLKARFEAWGQGRKNVWPVKKDSDTDGSPGLPTSVLRARDRRTREMVARQAEERVNRLEAMLRERGLHISQMRERDTFRSLKSDA
jgi:hypothetical protein